MVFGLCLANSGAVAVDLAGVYSRPYLSAPMPDILDRLAHALAGRYRIERELGQGGMAMVYLANDLKHDRAVALKVLRPELAAILGAERFLQEIKVTAKLQHPHILTLYDSGEADGLLFYVMPFIEGESLRDRLARERQLSVEEALRIGSQVASALDYAHRHNVIHRDIKPENILLEDGQAMVADFGIALAVRAAGGTRLTETGLSLGTPHYMSPEQATADRELDARSDIYSLGCVIYEMLAGEPPYTGPSAQAIIAKILTEEPRMLTQVRHTVPPHVAAAVAQALEKLPADRFASASQFSDALSGAAPVQRPVALAAGRAARPIWARPATAWGVTVLAVIVAAASLQRRSQPERRQVIRFEVALDTSLRVAGTTGRNIAIAPDGGAIAFRAASGGNPALYIRDLSQLESRRLPGTDRASQPFFSPDGAWIGFEQDGRLKKVPVSGGPSALIAEGISDLRGAAWTTDDRIVFRPGAASGLMWVPVTGGAPAILTRPDSAAGELDHRWPHALPGTPAVAFTVWTGDIGTARLAVVSLESGDVQRFGLGTSSQYAGGFLVFGRSPSVDASRGAIDAAPFDIQTKRMTGAPVTVLEAIEVKGGGAVEHALSANGTLALVAGERSDHSHLALVDRTGRERRLTEQGDFHPIGASPDGRGVAFSLAPPSGGHDVWLFDVDRDAMMRLTFDGGVSDDPSAAALWTSDARRVLFKILKGGWVLSVSSDGTGLVDTILRADPGILRALSPDGRTLFGVRGPSINTDIWAFDLESGDAKALVATRFAETAPSTSPDGRWLAYGSNETGRSEVYVLSLGQVPARWQVSTAGGNQPKWARDGRELLFYSRGSLVAVPVMTGPTFRWGPPRTLFADSTSISYDVLPDGTFVMERAVRTSGTKVMVAYNWIVEVQRQLGGAR